MGPTKNRMSTVFVSHGAPTLALDRVHGADFTRLATTLPRPRAVLVISAHWLDAPPTLGTTTTRALLHDYSGFPRELHDVRYAAPAARELAGRIAPLVPSLLRDDERPWDHGVWVPLLHMYPNASVPVLQLSLPLAWPARRIFELGAQLAPLRDDGVLVLGSGGAVHNLGRLDWSDDAPPPTWAIEFEDWLRERLSAGDHDAVVDFAARAPAARLAHPTHDHFAPLLVALGAAGGAAQVTFPIEGFDYGSLSRLAVQFR